MPINSRTKGAAFERLMVKKINQYLEAGNYNDRVKRNLDQTFMKGHKNLINHILILSSQHIVTASHDFTIKIWDFNSK